MEQSAGITAITRHDIVRLQVWNEDTPLPVLPMLNNGSSTVDRRRWDCLQRVRCHLKMSGRTKLTRKLIVNKNGVI